MQTLHRNDGLSCERINRLLDTATIEKFFKHLGSDWELSQDQKWLSKKFHFKNHYQTITFVNAISWMIQFKDHPPELEISRNYCLVRYTTPPIDGLSEYDFLCANKVEHLFQQHEETV